MAVGAAIWKLVVSFADLAERPLEAYRQEELDRYFSVLADVERSVEHRAAERRIWAIWCDHPETVARRLMRECIAHLAERRLEESAQLADEIIRRWPHWAEGWNKRATVHYLQGNDESSVRDIAATLEREPRHFGAFGGLAQICMRYGELDATRAVLDQMLRVHPFAEGIREASEHLSEESPATLH
jgi:hypothetical protein